MFGHKFKKAELIIKRKWFVGIALAIFLFQSLAFGSSPEPDSESFLSGNTESESISGTPANAEKFQIEAPSSESGFLQASGAKSRDSIKYKKVEVQIGSGSEGKTIALDIIGIATPKQIGLQQAATPVMKDLRHFLYYWLLPISVGVVLLVLGLLIWVAFRYNEKANPKPAKFTHNTLIEIIWTTIPILILLVIAFPSMQLLFKQERIPKADLTVKATGYQWYWDYSYPDYEDLTYSSIMLKRDEAEALGRPALLATDNALVVPAGATVRVLVTGEDVIHSWAVPSFGIKMDAIPGSVNETWFRVEKPGVYYGQCSELCGKDHAFMPVEVYVLPQADFDKWIKYKMDIENAEGEATNQFAALH